MPKELIKEIEPTAVALEEQPVSKPQSSPPGNQPLVQPGRTTDFSKLSLSELLNEVDMLQSPAPGVSGGIVEPLPVTNQARPDAETSSLLIQSKELSQSPNFVPTALQPSSDAIDEPEKAQEVFIDDYIVLGDSIDQEMKEKIRECIMSTRMASGGTNTPFVTRSVFKATSYCNRVLGRLNAPNHKRYRRDILLSMINMHERNQAWVDAAKTYERFLEEFAANDNYPFEQHEDAPGIPDLSAPLGSVRKLLEGFKRGAPTIPETHIRLAKSIGNSVPTEWHSINFTTQSMQRLHFRIMNRLQMQKSEGQSFESRKDAESNRAMLEIAETFLSGENYDSAIKFYDRLNRLEQLDDKERSIVQYKRGLAHFRRAVATLKQEEKVCLELMKGFKLFRRS